MMQAVSLGQLHKGEPLFTPTVGRFVEHRVSDPVRNAKNYCIIMNTLLRKAAERGGVHPVYLDRVSSDFATRIEGMLTAASAAHMMKEMFLSYCHLVRTHAAGGHSEIVGRVLLLIDAHLSEEITPRRLAELQSISPAYLSALFRKEMGKPLTAYVIERRLSEACRLLRETPLPVARVAEACGIADTQYFSKLFKRHIGITPLAYRKSL
jgi:AraC-like DNA-binding protein